MCVLVLRSVGRVAAEFVGLFGGHVEDACEGCHAVSVEGGLPLRPVQDADFLHSFGSLD
jgi:hypothetical protein